MNLRKAFTTMLLGAVASCGIAYAAAPMHDGGFRTLSAKAPRSWHKAAGTSRFASHCAPEFTVTKPDAMIKDAGSFGVLYGPDGTEWTYTARFDSDGHSGYSRAKMEIFDSSNTLVGSIDAPFTLAENETSVNSVQINPYITRKFFNVNDKYEVILFVHATTKDYTGSVYQLIYSIEPGQTEPLMRIDGNMIIMEDMASDAWSEKYYMVMMRDTMTEDYKYFVHYDVWAHADYSSLQAPRKINTFTLDYSYIAGSGENAAPIMLQNVSGKPMVAIAQYEKPFFDPDIPVYEEPVVTPDNNFVISLYDDAALKSENPEPVHTTTIPMTGKEGYLYSFPLVGGFRGNEDFSFGVWGDANEPYFIVTNENYVTATDDFMMDVAVYDKDGNKVKTICEDIAEFMMLMPVDGRDDQYVFFSYDGDAFDFVDYPSLKRRCSIPFTVDEYTLSVALDRVKTADGYNYAISVGQGEVDAKGDIHHIIGYFNEDGSLNRWDKVNLGPSIEMAQVAIIGEWLNPYLFNTDPLQEYMFLVKVPANDPTNPSRLEERLWVINSDGRKLLDYGPDAEMGGDISSVSVLNASTSHPMLSVAYYDWNKDVYTLNYNSLPLERYAGGEGTPDNPYLIAQPGDIGSMALNPAASYRLACDIDCSNYAFTGTGCDFKGTLDGDGHVISNLTLTGSGIFNTLEGGARVKNIVFDNVTIHPRGSECGLIATSSVYDGSNAPVVENIHVQGLTASSADFDGSFGGLMGSMNTYTQVIASSVCDAHVSLPRATVGGIVGATAATRVFVSACHVSGAIDGATVGGIGGLIGLTKIDNCHVEAHISASESAGGIVGTIEAYQSVRGSVANCYVEGLLATNGTEAARVGGIVGNIELADTVGVRGCVVALDKIDFNPAAAIKSAHRIAGHTSADELGEIDWESDWWTTFDGDPYEHRELWPRFPSSPDKGFADNYAIVSLPINGEADLDDASSVEGKSVDVADINTDLLTSAGFAFGSEAAGPWTISNGRPILWYEAEPLAVSVDPATLALALDDEDAVITFTVVGGKADNLDITTSDSSVAEIVSTSVNGSSVAVTVKAVAEGTADIEATAGSRTAKCVVTIKPAGIDAVIASPAMPLAFDGATVSGSGIISIYNVNGMMVASGIDHVSISSLPAGVYIARAGAATLKLMK